MMKESKITSSIALLFTHHLFIVCILISSGLHAQTSKSDSLQALLSVHKKSDTTRVNLLNEIAARNASSDIDLAIKYANDANQLSDSLGFLKGLSKSYKILGKCHQKSDFEKSLDYYQKAIQIEQELGNNAQVASLYMKVGIMHHVRANYTEAEGLYNQSLQLYLELGDESNVSRCYNNMGIIYSQQGNYPKTIDFFLKSLKIVEKAGDETRMSATYNNIGGLYQVQGDYPKALEYYEKSLELKEKLGLEAGAATSYFNIGGIHLEQKNFEKALEQFEKALEINLRLGKTASIAKCYFNMAGVYQERGEFPTALDYYSKSEKISLEIGDKYIEAEVYNELGSLYLKQKKYRKAAQYGLKAYTLGKEIGNSIVIKESAEVLASSNSELKRYKEAYDYHLIFKTMHDSLYNESNVKEITNLENQYHFDKEKEELAAQQAKKDAIQAAEVKRQKQLRNTFIGGSLIFLLLAIVILRNLMQKRKANALLAQQKEEIRSQAEVLKATNDQLLELNQFKEGLTGMIVHDLKNPLNTIINSSEEPVKTKQAGEQMLNMVLNILDVNKYEDTQLVIDHNETSITGIAFNAINQVNFLAEQKNITVNNGIVSDHNISGDSKIIERVFVNLLSNAIKYTPNHGLVTLSGEINEAERIIRISVTDTGQGIAEEYHDKIFDKFVQIKAADSGKVRSTGLGLTFCKIAVEAHGGAISVSSEVGKGATFTFSLPLGTTVDEIQPALKAEAKESRLEITEADRQLLLPLAQELTQHLVYEVTKIKALLHDYSSDRSGHVGRWLVEMDDCLATLNEVKYNYLIGLITGEKNDRS